MANATIRRRRLGAELRRLREAMGLTGEQVAQQLDCSHSTISRIELGRGGVRTRDVRDLLDLYGVEDEDRRAELIELARNPRRRERLAHGSERLQKAYQVYLDLEEAASEVTKFEPIVVPGLLQIEEYARAIERIGIQDLSDEHAEMNVVTRLDRQARRAERGGPSLWAILDESVLYRQIGGKGVLALQLDHLLQVAGDKDTVVQVLPFTSGYIRPIGFAVIEFEPSDTPALYLESAADSEVSERPEQIRLYSRIRDHLRAAALPPAKSRDRIRNVLKDLTG